MNAFKEYVNLITSSNYVYLCGNGGCCSAANHLACDLLKNAGIKAISLCANNSLLTAIANDCEYENVFYRQLETLFSTNDLLIALSGSGNSPNIINAVKYANHINPNLVLTITSGGTLGRISYNKIIVDGDNMQEWEDNINKVCHDLYKGIINYR